MYNDQSICCLLFIAGSVYVFGSNDSGQTWSQRQKLLASDGAIGDHFGISLAIYNHTIVAGALHDDNEKGANAGTYTGFIDKHSI